MTLERRLAAQRNLDRADLALRAGQLELAAELVSEAVRLEPDGRDARCLQARIALRAGRPQQALSALDALDLHDPEGRDEPGRAFLRAEALARGGGEDLALALLERLASAFPDDPWPRRHLAAIRLKRGESAAAIEHLGHLARLRPSDRAAGRLLARLLARTEPETAAAGLLGPDPGAADPVNVLEAVGQYRRAARLRDAEELCRCLLARCPQDAGLWREAGEVAAELGALDLAIARLERARELARGCDDQTLRSLAMALMQAGRLERACACWIRVARRVARRAEPWAGALVCAVMLGRRALQDRARRALIGCSSRGERRRQLSEMWQAATLGAHLNRAQRGELGAPPRQQSTLHDLLERSVATLHGERRRDATRADTHYHLAVCLDALGRPESSARCAAAAVAINPAYASARRLFQARRSVVRAA